ncbi:hypothetical protein D3C78_1326030 [compost metagenome]
MCRRKTGNVARATAADPILLRALLPGGDHLGILAQAQVVIAGEIQVMLAIKLNMATIAALIHLATAVSGALLPLLQRLFNTLLPAHYSAAL